MARFVIAGSSDCPRFARAELLADRLQKSLPNFRVHKVVKQPSEWSKFANEIIRANNWKAKHNRSPIIWRELVTRGGKGVLLGDDNDFFEYARAYYGLGTREDEFYSSEHLRNVAQNNIGYKNDVDREAQERADSFKPLRVALSNASSLVVYQLAPLLVNGDCFGRTDMALHLFDGDPEHRLDLEGLSMELTDLASPILRQIRTTQDISRAFLGCSIVLLLDEVPRLAGEKRRPWLQRIAALFEEYGEQIAQQCSKHTLIILALAPEMPLNFSQRVLVESLGRNRSAINPRNVVGIPRLQENIASRVLADKMAINPAQVVDLILWGNCGGVSFLDVRFARTYRYPGALYGPTTYAQVMDEVFWDKKFIIKELNKKLQSRVPDTVAKLQGAVPAVSRANAIASALTDWHNGLQYARFTSLVVVSDGSYGLPIGTVFSQPVTFSPRGYWRLVEDLQMTPEVAQKLKDSLKDIENEWQEAFGPTPPPTPPPKAPTPPPPPAKSPTGTTEPAMPSILEVEHGSDEGSVPLGGGGGLEERTEGEADAEPPHPDQVPLGLTEEEIAVGETLDQAGEEGDPEADLDGEGN